MALYEISSDDSEFIEFVLDNLLVERLEEVERSFKFIKKAHQDYALGDEAKLLDKNFLRVQRDSLLFLRDLRDRFVPVDTVQVDKDKSN